MSKDLRTWIVECLAADPRPQKDFARALGLDPAAITNLKKGTRQLSGNELIEAARYFKVVPPMLEQSMRRTQTGTVLGFAEDGVPDLTPGLRIAGELATDRWRRRDEPLLQARTRLIQHDLRFPAHRQTAWIVGDYTIEKQAIPGDVLICVSFDNDEAVPDGVLVIVERVRAEGALVEWTARRTRILGDRLGLVPESYNPRLNVPLIVGGGGDDAEVTRFPGKVVMMHRYTA